MKHFFHVRKGESSKETVPIPSDPPQMGVLLTEVLLGQRKSITLLTQQKLHQGGLGYRKNGGASYDPSTPCPPHTELADIYFGNLFPDSQIAYLTPAMASKQIPDKSNSKSNFQHA